jgi:hypothetical protein
LPGNSLIFAKKDMYTMRTFLVPLLFLTLISCGEKNAPSSELEQKISEGETLTLRLKPTEVLEFPASLNLDMNMDMAVMEMDQTLDMEILQTYRPGNGDTACVMSSKLTRIVMKQTPKGLIGRAIGPSSFDSNAPEEAEGAMAMELKDRFNEMINQSVSTAFGEQGNVLQQQGNTGMENLGKGSGGPGSAEGIVYYLAQFPESAIAPGDSWESSYQTGKGEEALTVSVNYTYLGMENGRVVLEAVGDIPQTTVERNETQVSLSSNFTSVLRVDPQTGITMEADMEQKMRMNAQMEGSEMPSEINISLTYRLN